MLSNQDLPVTWEPQSSLPQAAIIDEIKMGIKSKAVQQRNNHYRQEIGTCSLKEGILVLISEDYIEKFILINI